MKLCKSNRNFFTIASKTEWNYLNFNKKILSFLLKQKLNLKNTKHFDNSSKFEAGIYKSTVNLFHKIICGTFSN